MIKNILLVGLGGSLGSIARYASQYWITFYHSNRFPWATLSVNIVGCFLIGLFWGLSFKSIENNESWKLFLMTGLCGGFTTFSAFTLEGIGLIKENRLTDFLLYVIGSVLIGLLATLLGMKLVR
ncbi:MAG: fluoride efflux transporter CrcB [Bacteroidetes bacterium]|nr:fluoride efflux transporter CrcB [Bacteroidota bacterium]